MTGETRVAEATAGAEFVAHRAVKAGFAQVGEAVGREELGDVVDAVVGRDELFAGRGVDAVKAGEAGWRRRDSDVNLGGAGGAQHADNLAARGSPDEGVVYHDDPFAFEYGAYGAQFQFDPEVSDRLVGFDEGSAHIVASQ